MSRGKRKIGISSHRHRRVLGTKELREQLPSILRGFREAGAEAEPVIGGANREPQVVLMAYERYLGLMDELDNLAIQSLYQERVEGREGLTGRSLEDAARELGFNPEELLAEPALDIPSARSPSYP